MKGRAAPPSTYQIQHLLGVAVEANVEADGLTVAVVAHDHAAARVHLHLLRRPRLQPKPEVQMLEAIGVVRVALHIADDDFGR